MKKIELLSPAGDLEKLSDALYFGADAVYLGPKEFSLRTGDDSFGPETMARAAEYVHSRGKKVYFALNIMPVESLINGLSAFIDRLLDLQAVPDAFIVSDPGVLVLLKQRFGGNVDYHLSTQANCINSQSAVFWAENGIRRIILGRELSLEDIRKLRRQIPERLKLELEVFVHGAMCMSYSGRCLISSYLTGRHSNRGDCSHPCRWNYSLMEQTRPGEYFPVEEDSQGTYLMNSCDLNLGNHVAELIEDRDRPLVDSIKIEGRNKGTYYTSVVTAVYRKIIDGYYQGQKPGKDLLDQLLTVSHRPYSEGFIFNAPRQNTRDSIYIWDYRFLGKCTPSGKAVKVEVRNQFYVGEQVELFLPAAEVLHFTVAEIMDFESGLEADDAKNEQTVLVTPDIELPGFEYGLLRKRRNKA